MKKFSRKGAKLAKNHLQAAAFQSTPICIHVPFVLFESFVVIKFCACPKGIGSAEGGSRSPVHKGAKLVKHRQWIREVQLDTRITLFLCVLAPLREILNDGY